MAKYNKRAQIDVYEREEEKAKSENPWPGLIIGGIVILLIVASCST